MNKTIKRILVAASAVFFLSGAARADSLPMDIAHWTTAGSTVLDGTDAAITIGDSSSYGYLQWIGSYYDGYSFSVSQTDSPITGQYIMASEDDLNALRLDVNVDHYEYSFYIDNTMVATDSLYMTDDSDFVLSMSLNALTHQLTFTINYDASGEATYTSSAVISTLGAISLYVGNMVIPSTITVTADGNNIVPEPGTYAALAGIAALGLCALRRSRKPRA